MIEQILQLPVIVQGALGSALFALVLWVFKILGAFLVDKFSFFDKKIKVHKLNAQLVMCTALKSDDTSIITFALVGLISFALSNFFKAVGCVLVGFLLSDYFPLFKEISILFALYFIYVAITCFAESVISTDFDEKIKRIETQLKALSTKET